MMRVGPMTLALLAAFSVTGALTVLLVKGLALDMTHPALATLITPLFAATTVVLAMSAIIALVGVRASSPSAPPVQTTPGRCAVVWLLAGEPPEPLARRLSEFLEALSRTGQAQDCDVFVLSDTQGDAARARERAALAPDWHRIAYRNRAKPTGRKPGNVEDWLRQHGAGYDTMLLLDADSGFSAHKLAQMRAQMAANPQIGLLQAAIRLRPGVSRFGKMQRLSARLSGPVFTRGLARLSGTSGNFWGHNALIRTRALAQITPLPVLSGAPPFGGPILSHDFIEAAHLRRAGWQVVLCPDSRGSFEDAPDTIAGHLRRDRRWAQGNLQHLRLIADAGLHPVSRLHLALGIMSYLAAPIWLGLVLVIGSGAVHATSGVIWPLAGVLVLLVVPKLAGLLARPAALAHPARRRVMLRAVWAELGLSTLFAPIGMVWRSAFVAALFLGRSVDWVASGQGLAPARQPGRAEALCGALIIAAVALPQLLIIGPASAALAGGLVLPVALPLLAAPLLWPWFDAAQAQSKVAGHYDQSMGRFPAKRGLGAALAIHRPLWANGGASRQAAAVHINTVIARQAETALGQDPERVIVLGSGVGGTVCHLAHAWPRAQLFGIAGSAEQVRLAQGFARAQGLDSRCRFLRSDFTLPMTLPKADLAIAVESHLQAPSAEAFLAATLRQLEPGGVLVLVDDMLARPEASLSRPDIGRLAQVRRGGRPGHVPDRDGLVQSAERLGFVVAARHDLTPHLRLGRMRDRVFRLAGPVAHWLGLATWPVFGNTIGDNALTDSSRAPAMRYSCLVLRKPGAARGALVRTEAVA